MFNEFIKFEFIILVSCIERFTFAWNSLRMDVLHNYYYFSVYSR